MPVIQTETGGKNENHKNHTKNDSDGEKMIFNEFL